MTDRVAAYLTEVRGQLAASSPERGFGAEDVDWLLHVRPLLAAVEAAQGLVARWEAEVRHLDAAADRIPDSEPGGTLKLVRAQAHEDCARALREAVSAALLSEEIPGD